MLLSPDDLMYLQSLVRRSVLGEPTEFTAYGVITEAFILHKQPRDRFIIFPQLYMRWNPSDTGDARNIVPDFGIGKYFDDFPHIRLQGGVEVKAAVKDIMHLPSAKDAYANSTLVHQTIHYTILQAQDQAKAAVKGRMLPSDKKLLWLIFVGPYFTCVEFGPFTQSQLITRGHRFNDSGDWAESLKIKKFQQTPSQYKLYRLGTVEAAKKIEEFLAYTSAFIQ